MIAPLIRFSLTQRLMLLLLAAALVIAGLWGLRTLPIDAFPDITSPQVQVIAKAPGMAPSEVETRITFPLEMEMQGLPRQTVLRSTTKYALAVIVVDFEDGTDIYWARSQVSERLNQVRASLPANAEVGLAPITTPLSELYMYRIDDSRDGGDRAKQDARAEGGGLSNAELRAVQDWVIRPRLRTVAGVADVNSLGGEVRAFEVAPDTRKLATHGITVDELSTAIEMSNRNAGGDRINRGDEILLVRTIGALQSLDDVRAVTVATRHGVPVRVGDVAEVRFGALTRYGGVTYSAQGEAVTGLVLLRKGENGRSTVEGVKVAMEEIKAALPPGVTITPFYDRTELIDAAMWTVEKALGEAVLLVLLVLIVLLGNLRAALTVALILPLSVLATLFLMRVFGVTANLMSLGGLAIAVGILVDAAVVVVENVHTQLARAPKGVDRLHLVYRATLEVAAPVMAGVLIIVVVLLPLFSLTGLEGKLFTPLAVTIAFALVASLVLSLTVIPVLASFLMRAAEGHGAGESANATSLSRGPRLDPIGESANATSLSRGPRLDSTGEGRVADWLHRAYRPVVAWALTHRAIAVIGAFVLLGVAVALFPFLGKEFMPVMDEGTTVVIIEKNPNISLEASLAVDATYHRAMMELPEVTGVMSRTGADELRLDPMGLYQTDNFLLTRPRSAWTRSLGEFQEDLRTKLEAFEGIELAFTQPIDMRVSEMLTGVRATLAVKLSGDDLAVLDEKAQQIEELLGGVRGAIDIVRPPVLGQKYLEIRLRPTALGRYGIRVEDVNRLIEVAVGGEVVSEIVEGSRRTPVLLRLPESVRTSPAALAGLMVETPGKALVPLSLLADIREAEGPVQVVREHAKRVVAVQVNVEGRDVVGFVDEVRAAIEREVKLPPGYFITYGGQFENQQRAAARLGLVVPVSVALIFLMLFMTFRSLSQAGLILLNIPFALIGGVVSLFVSGLYLSVPASVGFITLFGVAVLNGVVMVTYFNQLRVAGRTVLQAVQEGAERRLRPVLMTALIASLGLVPMLAATGPGSELQRPLAVVVIGGLFTSTLLTLVLLPTLYAWMELRAERRDDRIGDKP